MPHSSLSTSLTYLGNLKVVPTFPDLLLDRKVVQILLKCLIFSTISLVFFFLNFIFKLYIIVLVLPNIKMNPPQVYMCSPS